MKRKQKKITKRVFPLVLVGLALIALLILLLLRRYLPMTASGRENPLQKVLGATIARYNVFPLGWLSYRSNLLSLRVTPTPQEYWLEDQISSISRFADLPDDIKQDLDRKYFQSNVKSAVYWIPSTASKKSLFALRIANFVNKVSGGVVAYLDGGKEKVYQWLAVQIAKTAARGLISTATGSDTAADITIWLYDTSVTQKKIAGKTFKAITKGDQLSLEIAVWILKTEMAYINSQVSQGYQKLASLGKSGEPLKVYIVGIQGENKKNEKYFDTGLEFYYYDSSRRKHINYFSNVVSAQVQSVSVKGR